MEKYDKFVKTASLLYYLVHMLGNICVILSDDFEEDAILLRLKLKMSILLLDQRLIWSAHFKEKRKSANRKLHLFRSFFQFYNFSPQQTTK